ncbi:MULTISPECIES: CBS domain-containing protein [Amycolatopsis]|uniref:BON domain-containing protein n=2 Tax=Amycolatopsis TaxID=1813 RepID=A0A1I3KUB7_9PSEU|nr:CBS domain-containing protein [Amycolatopsis sacchari]SFI75970.1 BON domain-containing protein [Amycolatopsis sacchari]
MRRLLVRDLMTTAVRSVRRTTPVKDVVGILVGAGISAVPVVDDERTVVGVVSEADLMDKEVPAGRWAGRYRRARSSARTAEDLMAAPVSTIGPEESIVEAARRMSRRHVKRLPVVDRYGKLEGVLSRSDIVRIFARGDEELREEIAVEVFERALCVPEGDVSIEVTDGVVTLTGRLKRRSAVPIAETLTRQVPGVVDVVCRLSFDFDDSHVRAQEPTNRGVWPR